MPLGFAVITPAATHFAERWTAADGWLAGTAGRILGVGEGRGIALVYVAFGACITLLSLAALRHRILADFDRRTPDAEADDPVGLRELGTSPPTHPAERT